MDNKPLAIIFMLLSAFSFSMMSVTIKLTGNISIFQRIFFTNLISGITAYIVISSRKNKIIKNTKSIKHLVSRSLFGYMSMYLSFYAVTHLLLADSSMLSNTSPFFVTIFAVLFLKEKLSPVQIPVLILAFLGALFVIKPGFNFKVIPAITAIGSAFFGAQAYTVIRFLKGRENGDTIVFFFSFFSVLISIPFMLKGFVFPQGTKLLLLLLMGIFWTLGQYALTLSYQYAPAGEVSIYTYFNIVFAVLWGFLIWKEVPDALSIIGGAFIVISGVINYRFNKKTMNKTSNIYK